MDWLVPVTGIAAEITGTSFHEAADSVNEKAEETASIVAACAERNDQLLTVRQTDSSSYGTAVTLLRTFYYSSLGRLVEVVNSESGSTTYKYRPGGLLWERGDIRGITTTMSYDAAQRLVGKSYSDGTPAVVYCYDGQIYLGIPAQAEHDSGVNPNRIPG